MSICARCRHNSVWHQDPCLVRWVDPWFGVVYCGCTDTRWDETFTPLH